MKTAAHVEVSNASCLLGNAMSKLRNINKHQGTALIILMAISGKMGCELKWLKMLWVKASAERNKYTCNVHTGFRLCIGSISCCVALPHTVIDSVLPLQLSFTAE